jgi:Escherichia/Staphylococcus phage prohead protease
MDTTSRAGAGAFCERSASRPIEVRADGDGLTLHGYAAVFDTWAEIDSWEGRFRERIVRGAFAASLTERTPVLQFDHGRSSSIGSVPLGAFSALEERDAGLWVEARLHDNALVRPVRDAIASGALRGMSIRFVVQPDGDRWERIDGVDHRTISGADLFELGPVVFPAYDGTTAGVRSSTDAYRPRLALLRARLALGGRA